MIKPSVKVFKLGGASLVDAAAIRNIARILQTYKEEKLVIVVSAMGKTTNALEKVAEAHALENGMAQPILDEIKNSHYRIMQELFELEDEVFDLVNDAFVEIDWVLEDPPHDNYDYMYDQIVSVGELVSSHIVCAFLNRQALPTHWLDARDLILTDEAFREGRVQWPQTLERTERYLKPLVEKSGFVISQGFIGGTSENFTTTLGREGSDYTAAIFSFCLDAETMTIWKDVPGVLTADPRLFKNTTKIDRLSYKEAVEMTYYGAKVIHPKTIKPLQNKGIPLYVKSFVKPEGDGTCISNEADDIYPPIIAVEQNQALLQISTRDFSFVAEQHMSRLFGLIADLRLRVNLMQNSAISFSICVNDAGSKVDQFIAQIQDQFKVVLSRDLTLITVRHYQEDLLNSLAKGKIIMLEERIRNTAKMAVKETPAMQWKEEGMNN